MYSVILMTAMTASAPETPQFFWRGCHGCYGGCVGWSSCYGCTGCYGCGGCWGGGFLGLRARWYAGCHGCTGYSCCGCSGVVIYSGCTGCTGYGPAIWGAPAPANEPPPKANPKPEPKKDPEKPKVGARIIIDVPASAKLYVDGNLMKSATDVRYFYTPPLDHGQTYFYDVRIETEQNGKPQVHERRIYVRSGDLVRETFKNSDTANIAKK